VSILDKETRVKTQLVRFLVLATVLVMSGGFAVAVHASNGTQLSVIASTDDTHPACYGNPVTINITLTSTGSAAQVSLFASTDGSTFTNLGSITNWSVAGRTKTADGTIQVLVSANSATVVEIRAIQPGENGDPRKAVSTEVTITPQCGDGSAAPAAPAAPSH
jgi:hypothetical protein